MKTDKANLLELLSQMFEAELTVEMAEFPIMQFPAEIESRLTLI
jgi:hypothetical protein